MAGCAQQPPPAAAASASEPQSYHNVQKYGAVGDGATDDAAAIQSAINAAQSAGGGVVFLPAGSYAVSRTLSITASNVGMRGVGMASEIVGTSADGDIIYAGPGSSGVPIADAFFGHFRVRAAVTKTSGSAFLFANAQRFRVVDVRAAGPGVANNLYDAFTFKYFDTCFLENVLITATNTGLTLYGQSNQSWGADFWVSGASRILSCKRGVHIAGSCGGIQFDEVDIIGNETNVYLDDSLSGAPNREIFFDSCFIDSASYNGVEIMPNGVSVLHFWNTWVASSGGSTKGYPEGVNILAHPGGVDNPSSVIVSGCRIFNALGSGIVAQAGAWTITGCAIEFNGNGSNGGYGILLDGPGVSDVVISGNSIRHNNAPGGTPGPTGAGIHISQGVDHYIITSNVVRHNGQNDIVDHGGPSKVVRDNLVTGGGGTGQGAG